MKNKTITISSLSDIYKFYNRLFIYKIFLKNYKFNINININIDNNLKEELESVINILNIKEKYKRYNYIYDYLYDLLDNYYKDKNICEFDCDKTCIAKRLNKTKVKKNGCCGNCKYITDNGCSIKCLTCKMFFCKIVKDNNILLDLNKNKIYKYFLSFRRKNILQMCFYKEKDEILKYLCNGSLLYFFIKEDLNTFFYKNK